jgi:Arc/MetJ-type ribon-helix-helix transcriptional regulator
VIKLEIALRLPEELIEKADILAKLEYKNRAEIIKSALKEYIRRIENIEKLKERATELYLNDKLEYNELVIIIGRQNADSVKASKRILDRNNKIAKDIARSWCICSGFVGIGIIIIVGFEWIQRCCERCSCPRTQRDEHVCRHTWQCSERSLKDYLLTDDFRALGEIEKQIGERVVLSPFILKVLVIRGIIDERQALTKLEEMAEKRDWLERPIYRYARKYF